MDKQAEQGSCENCEEYKCSVVNRRILLTGIMVPWFEPVSVGSILSCIGEEDENIFSSL